MPEPKEQEIGRQTSKKRKASALNHEPNLNGNARATKQRVQKEGKQRTYTDQDQDQEIQEPVPKPESVHDERRTSDPKNTPSREPVHEERHTPDPKIIPPHEPVHEQRHAPSYEPVYEPVYEQRQIPSHEPVHEQRHAPSYGHVYEPVHEQRHAPSYGPVHEPVYEQRHAPLYEPVYGLVYEQRHIPSHEPVHEQRRTSDPKNTPLHGPVHEERHTSDVKSEPAQDKQLAQIPLQSRVEERTSKERHLSKAAEAAVSYEDVVFTIQCPARKQKSGGKDDAFQGHEKLPNGLSVDYTVRPGKWGSVKTWRNVRLNDQTFGSGDIVYVNRQVHLPKPPPSDADIEQLVAYDRENFWVAKIADIRADSPSQVLLRVVWLYWPDELPMGRQPYHAQDELVLSNAMDIIEATTISRLANIVHWNEWDDAVSMGERDGFWRQTLDISKSVKRVQGVLGELRKHCRCQAYYNPDAVMYLCAKEECGTWNHEHCLLDEALRQTWKSYKSGQMDQFEQDDPATPNSKHPSVGDKIFSLSRKLEGRLEKALEAGIEAVREETQPQIHQVESPSIKNQPNPTTPKLGRPRKQTSSATPKRDHRPGREPSAQKGRTPSKTKPWEGILRATISNPAHGPPFVRLQEIQEDGKAWRITVHCLNCRDVMR